jgi:hypothetical protein
VLDPGAVPDIEPDEILGRFVLYSGHVRASDRTVKPEAFMPHPHNELSVTRRREATEEELWAEGQRIGAIRQLTLKGRADVSALVFTAEGLRTVSDPIPKNPNHANVTDWPNDKPTQKLKAIQIANKAVYVLALSTAGEV